MIARFIEYFAPEETAWDSYFTILANLPENY
jgi:hypothetical protein